MDTEVVAGAGLAAAESVPSSEQASVVPEPQPAGQAPDYLSRDEALRLLEQIRAEAREYGQRGAQSFIDRARLNERVRTAEETLARIVQDGLLDEQQASVYRQEARWKALTDLLPEQETPQAVREPLPQQPASTPPGISPVMLEAYQYMAERGITRADPEYVDPAAYPTPIAWTKALDKAVAAKAARLAREQARQQVAQQTPQPQPQRAQPTGAAAVEVGSGTATATATLTQLREQLRKAYQRGDYAERDRISEEIDRLIAAGR